MAEKKIKIRLVHSPIGYNEKQKKTLTALGLGKVNKVVEKKATAEILGMVQKVVHLVELSE